MESHAQYSDLELIHKLEKGAFPEKLFNHEAHLRLAHILCLENSIEQAIEKTCIIILSYVNAIGAIQIYNEALTHSAVRLVNHRLLQEKSKKSFSEFISANTDLKSDFKELLKQF